MGQTNQPGHPGLVARRHHLHRGVVQAAVKLTFMQGASLEDPAKLFNSSLDGNARRRSISTRVRRSTRARSRR